MIDRIACAVETPAGNEMDGLLAAVRSSGLHALGSPSIRTAAGNHRRRSYSSLSKPVSHMLTRLERAGLPPTYNEYIAKEILNPCGIASSGPSLLRYGIRSVHDLLEDLITLPELQNHLRREDLKNFAFRAIETCRAVGFPDPMSQALTPEVLNMSLLPESGVADELLFLRVVQSTDIIFSVAKACASAAANHIVHDNIAEALLETHCMVLIEELLAPVLRLLSVMSLESWIAIRPFITRPSAIQSESFRDLTAKIKELGRLKENPRLPKHELPLMPCLIEQIEQAQRKLDAWNLAHLGLAKKLSKDPENGGYITDGIRYLERQVALSYES